VAVFPSVLAYLFRNRGVEAVGPNAVGHSVHLMPVVFLDEDVGWFHAAGALLVASGIRLKLSLGR